MSPSPLISFLIGELMGEFVKAKEIQKGDQIQVGGVWCRCNEAFAENDLARCIMFVYTPHAGHMIVPNDFPIQRVPYLKA